MTIFIRTYRGDRDWIRHSLPTLVRHGSGFNEIVLAMPQGDEIHFSAEDTKGARVVIVEPDPCHGYIAQQITKLYADTYCPDEYICFIDSDTLATAPFTPQTWTNAGGQPIQLTRQWDQVGEAGCWKWPTSAALGFDPQFEHMACMPLVYHRDTLACTRTIIRNTHRIEARDYLRSCKQFSEFNAIGAVAYQFQRGSYDWRMADPATDGYPRTLRQFWSYGGIEPNRTELEKYAQ